MSVIKLRPKSLLLPVTTGTKYKINQSEIKVNKSNSHKVQEDVCKQFMIGFGLTSDWLRK